MFDRYVLPSVYLIVLAFIPLFAAALFLDAVFKDRTPVEGIVVGKYIEKAHSDLTVGNVIYPNGRVGITTQTNWVPELYFLTVECRDGKARTTIVTTVDYQAVQIGQEWPVPSP